MPFMTWLNHHRLLVSGFGLVVLVLTALAGVWFFMIRSTGTQIDLRQALKLYRHDERGGAAGEGLPEPGVYVYQTSGGEQLSLPGMSRRFPSASNLIVTDPRCASMEWAPIDEHMEGIVVCRQPDGALVMARTTSLETIAGIRTSETVRCPSAAYFVPPAARAGDRWHAVCHGPGQTDRLAGQVVGMTTLVVNGRTVPALHTRLDISISGQESGSNPADYWVSPDTGLILRQKESVSVSQAAGPLGAVHYREEMAITMTSLSPDR
jgi:hypothetical protein